MTEAPVPIAAQIAAVHDEVEKWNEFGCAHPKMTPGERDLAARELEMWRAVLATLQQHERAMAALRPFAEIADAYAAVAHREGRKHHSGGHRVSIGLGECRAARAALDDAASVATTPAGKG